MQSFWGRAVVLVLVSVGSSFAGCATRTHKAEASPDGVKPSGVAVAAPAAIEAVPPHAVVPPQAIKWMPFALGGPGVQVAVLAGDVDKPGPFVLRIKSPKGAKVPPHWHPGDEHITVISGTFALGMGDVFDPKQLQTVPAGSYALLPRDMHHFALSKTATVVQVHGNGPFQVNFVNPADDPRTRDAAP